MQQNVPLAVIAAVGGIAYEFGYFKLVYFAYYMTYPLFRAEICGIPHFKGGYRALSRGESDGILSENVMLSLLHIAMDKTKEELLNEIPVADSIRDSLLGSSGPYSDLLVFFKNYERGNWEEIESFTGKYGINCTSLNYAYIEAVKWCNSLIEA